MKSGAPLKGPKAEAELRILATCTLGLGFSYRGFQAGLEHNPHLIACDAGSSDKGPYYLGAGVVSKSATTLKRDLALLLEGARRLGVPFITGSAGGAGGKPHVDECVRLVREIAEERGMHFRLAVISSEMSAELLKRKLREGRLVPCGDVDDITEETIDRLAAAVGMMGAEPYMKALDMGADVIIAGRSTDPSIFAGMGLRAGLDPGAVWHAAKCIDKGYLATTEPENGSPVLARITNEGFTIEATRENAYCTVQTVAGIVLHENPDPFLIAQPTGSIDSSECTYEQVDSRTVRVRGSKFAAAKIPTIKIDGAELVGYRTIMIAGIRDPRLIERIDEFLPAYRHAVEAGARTMGILPDQYQLQFRVYGKDGVMGAYEPDPRPSGKELCIIADVVGTTPEISSSVANRLGPNGTRLDIFKGLGGGGNFAFPFSPSVIKVGPAYKWSVWHLMEVDAAELTDLFPIQLYDL